MDPWSESAFGPMPWSPRAFAVQFCSGRRKWHTTSALQLSFLVILVGCRLDAASRLGYWLHFDESLYFLFHLGDMDMHVARVSNQCCTQPFNEERFVIICKWHSTLGSKHLATLRSGAPVHNEKLSKSLLHHRVLLGTLLFSVGQRHSKGARLWRTIHRRAFEVHQLLQEEVPWLCSYNF